MNGAADPLAELRPLHLPTEIGWWPPAPGWWVLAVVLLALLAWAAMIWRRGAARREALGIIRALAHAKLTGPMLAQQINLLLRRYAMACYPRQNAAALAGPRWLEFLDRHGAGREFGSVGGQALIGAAFAAHADVDRDELIGLATHWIKHNSRRSKHIPRDDDQ
jgi:hypothetical protein